MSSDKREILKTYFGYDNFRQGQEKVIDSALSGRDVLCVMPTGAGKSICYQIPALIFGGVTIVVSPLISLMKDQVQMLVGTGVKAAYINSSLSLPELEETTERVAKSQYKIIYVAPERLLTAGFLSAIRPLDISFVVVDEAHCISRWGHDFRPSYLDIVKFIEKLPVRPVVGAFTATATPRVREDINEILGLENPLVEISSFDRPNLYFDVRRPKSKDRELLDIVRAKRGESGIVYCTTRKKVEEVCQLLVENGFSAVRYHAGLDDNEKAKNQDDFIFDNKRIMVATNAFGMGIDKGNVSFIIHYNMPKDMESYYQEAGRAGRDGSRAECILLYSDGDVYTNKLLIDNASSDFGIVDNEYKLLNKMIGYCKTDGCLRGYILDYFGEKFVGECGNCGNCLGGDLVEVDMTEAAKTVINCVRHMPRAYGKNILVTVLQGGDQRRIVENYLSLVEEYGALRKFSRGELSELVDKMITAGLLEQFGNEYPVLRVARGVDARELQFKIRVRKKPEKTKAKGAKSGSGTGKASGGGGEVSRELYARLKELRFSLARREGVPAYIIFSDAALTDMCAKLPETREEFLCVNGVGEKKCARYGEDFLAAIKAFKEGT